jgi:hypothetical protein
MVGPITEPSDNSASHGLPALASFHQSLKETDRLIGVPVEPGSHMIAN